MKRISMCVTAFLALLMFCGLSLAKEPKVFKLGFMTSFSGPYAAVAETQRMGALLRIEEINNQGGLNMPWGKVPIETLIKDDEMKLDIGVRRGRELHGAGIHALTGTVFNPMAAAMNEEMKLLKLPYLPGCVPALDSFKKGNPAEGTFSVAFTPWSIGYLCGASSIKILGKKDMFFQSRSDSWGHTMHEGLEFACQELGGKVSGFTDLPAGTVDYTATINKALAQKPDIFFTSMFGGDAIACLKQARELGLYDASSIFNTWITNVVATGIPQDALTGLHALAYYYYNMEGIKDQDLVNRAKEFTQHHEDKYGEPPDAYGTIAYLAVDVLFQAVEKAGSFETGDIAKALGTEHFSTVKGDVYFRKDHQMVSEYLAFLVRGKTEAQRKGKWDVFEVIGSYGGDQALPSLEYLGW